MDKPSDAPGRTHHEMVAYDIGQVLAWISRNNAHEGAQAVVSPLECTMYEANASEAHRWSVSMGIVLKEHASKFKRATVFPVVIW